MLEEYPLHVDNTIDIIIPWMTDVPQRMPTLRLHCFLVSLSNLEISVGMLDCCGDDSGGGGEI